MAICLVDSTASGDQATVGANWNIIQVNIDGAVIGPASSVNGNLPSFSGTTGKLIADSGIPASTVLVDGDIGTNIQAYDAGLASIAGLTTAADMMIYTTASDTYAVTALTSTARSLLDDTTTAAMRSTLGLGSTDSPTFAGLTVSGDLITLGNATDKNVAVGIGAFANNTTGTYNTASGSGALYSNTEGYGNTASGSEALYSNTIGSGNTASGSGALYSTTTGSSNTASGYLALYSNTEGQSNTASGYLALYLNTTGNSNTASGSSALYSNTTGSSNTASGYGALSSNTTGSSNTANGYTALSSNTTGYSNTANGYTALLSNTTGIANTANGYTALYSNTTGNSNTANGYGAGRYIANGSTANATGSNSVFLGADTKANADGETNQIVIGYDATGNGSNTVTIGNSSITDNYFNGNIAVTGTVDGVDIAESYNIGQDYALDGDFNFWDRATTQAATGYGSSNTWEFVLPSGAGTFSRQTSAIAAKSYLGRVAITAAVANAGVRFKLSGKPLSSRAMTALIYCKYNTAAPTGATISLTGQATGSVSGALTVPATLGWVRVDLASTAFTGTNIAVSILNSTSETWDIDIEKIRLIPTEQLPTGIIPEWAKQVKDVESERNRVLQYFEYIGGKTLSSSLATGLVFSATLVIGYIKFASKVRTPTITVTGTINARNTANNTIVTIDAVRANFETAGIDFAGTFVGTDTPILIRNGTAGSGFFVDSCY